jgi:hypothetical protein
MTVRVPAFEFHNGRTARTAQDLLQVLEEGPVDLWSDHVVPGPRPDAPVTRNDFASWAEHGLREPALADRLRGARTREDTIHVLKHWLAPHLARQAAGMRPHAVTDFLLGLGTGIIVTIIVLRVVAG